MPMNKIHFIFTKDSFMLDKAVESVEQLRTFSEKCDNEPYKTFYDLSFHERPDYLDAAGSFIFLLAEIFTQELSNTAGIELTRKKTTLAPSDETYGTLLERVPFAIGTQYINKWWIKRQYKRFLDIFKTEISKYNGKVSLYFTEKSSKLHIPERVFFHLVENTYGEYPFAFLATYATKKGSGAVCHVPLQYAMTEYKGDKTKILDLLSCLNKAAEVSPLIANFMDSGELFHPLGLTSDEAYRFLLDTEALESCGIRCRIPNWWKKRYSNMAVSVKVGDKKPTLLGIDSVLSVVPNLTVGGEALTESEIRQLLQQTEGLALKNMTMTLL